MRRWPGVVLVAAICAGLAHLVALGLVPRVIMGVAMERIAEQAGGWNKLSHAPRVTARTQRIVRSSPDLAYSTCALDLTHGPARLLVNPSGGYASVAVYGANTNTVFVLNDRDMGDRPVRLLIVGPRSPVAARPGETTVSLPSPKGLVLIRRLAPTDADYARVDSARQQDQCQHVK
jgi:uncharacterized membrane protein